MTHLLSHRLSRLVLLCAGAAMALPAAAATNYSETWDTRGDLAGWFPNTISSTLVNPGSGGNGGGFLETRRSGAFPSGAATDLGAATGSFASGPWTASVDLIGLGGFTSDVWLRFRFQDSSFNGWRFRLTGLLNDSWQTFGVTFDPSWTDLEAGANGWETDLADGSGSVSWAQTLGDVYTTEIRIDGTPTLLAGIDNFSLSVAAVPEPSTYALLLAGLAVIGSVTGRRRSK